MNGRYSLTGLWCHADIKCTDRQLVMFAVKDVALELHCSCQDCQRDLCLLHTTSVSLIPVMCELTSTDTWLMLSAVNGVALKSMGCLHNVHKWLQLHCYDAM